MLMGLRSATLCRFRLAGPSATIRRGGGCAARGGGLVASGSADEEDAAAPEDDEDAAAAAAATLGDSAARCLGNGTGAAGVVSHCCCSKLT